MKKFGMLLAVSMLSLSAIAHENGTIKIYDAKFSSTLFPKVGVKPLLLKDGKAQIIGVPDKARILNQNLVNIRNYFFENFMRKSWDDKSAPIVAYINSGRFAFIDLLGVKQNAYWSSDSKSFHFGAGGKTVMDDFEKALDVVAHEYTHAVIDSTCKLKYEGQSGALNEHLADVFGALINQKYNNPVNPFLIGATVLRGDYAARAQALRDMKVPALGVSPQPSHMSELETAKYSKFVNCISNGTNDNCGVHVLSGIPNRLAAVVMESIPWEDSAQLFYNVMTKRLTANSQFVDYKKALLDECREISAQSCIAVEKAVKAVGL